MTDQPKRPARPGTPAPKKPVPHQKKHLAHKPHETLPGALRTRPLENIKLARTHAHPIQRRPALTGHHKSEPDPK